MLRQLDTHAGHDVLSVSSTPAKELKIVTTYGTFNFVPAKETPISDANLKDLVDYIAKGIRRD